MRIERVRLRHWKNFETADVKLSPRTFIIGPNGAGKSHLAVVFRDWEKHGARQLENRFSDGTLRLIGMLWMLLEGGSLLLMEEPELSLNHGLVQQLPSVMYRALKGKGNQLLVSTHSPGLLSDKSIGGEEVLIMEPGDGGTVVFAASDREDLRELLEGGMSAADAVLPRINPENIHRVRL